MNWSSPHSKKTDQNQPSNIEEYQRQLAFLKREYVKLRNEYEKSVTVASQQADELRELKTYVLTLQTDTKLEQIQDELDLERELTDHMWAMEYDPTALSRYKPITLYNSRIFTDLEEKQFRDDENMLASLDIEIDAYLAKKKK